MVFIQGEMRELGVCDSAGEEVEQTSKEVQLNRAKLRLHSLDRQPLQ